MADNKNYEHVMKKGHTIFLSVFIEEFQGIPI
jgi:hypothetical protein